MRFFQGMRGPTDNSRSKGLAGAIYKQKLLGKAPETELSAQEKYIQMYNNKMDSVMEDLAKGKKNSFKLPGTKDTPKQVSKHVKDLLEQIAMKKMEKELKKQKAKSRDRLRAKQAVIKAQQRAQQDADLKKRNDELQAQQKLLQQQQLQHQQQQDFEHHHFYGHDSHWWQ